MFDSRLIALFVVMMVSVSFSECFAAEKKSQSKAASSEALFVIRGAVYHGNLSRERLSKMLRTVSLPSTPKAPKFLSL